jgi:hypothetical protein
MLVSAFSALYSLARSEKSCTLMLVLAFLEVSFECTGGAKLAPYTISTCERVQAELHPLGSAVHLSLPAQLHHTSSAARGILR